MPSILPILNYADLFESDFTLCSHKLYSYTDEAGYSHPFVNLLWESPYSIPIPLEYTLNPLSLELHDSYLACNLNLYEGTLKYFYPDYQNYYYLPLEDTAIHKSIGEYVDRSARKKLLPKTVTAKKRACSYLSSVLCGNHLLRKIISPLSPIFFMMMKPYGQIVRKTLTMLMIFLPT